MNFKLNSKKVFLDAEFTGLHRNATLISLAMISEDGRELYLEFSDYDRTQVDDWLRDNVLAGLTGERTVTRQEAKTLIKGFLVNVCHGPPLTVVTDRTHYDWVLFCDLWGEGFDIPDEVNFITLDLATMFWMVTDDPDVEREKFAGIAPPSIHNALHDARVIRSCFKKLMAVVAANERGTLC